MKYFAVIGALFIGLILAPLAVAQQELYRPPLGDIMGKIQLRHIKLWFAGKAGNWELAADLYRGIPVELVTNTADPIRAIREAIEAKDSAAFAKGYGELTLACNACHQGIGRSFIVIQKPTASPFTDQSISPPKR
jgi:hypothetical protein